MCKKSDQLDIGIEYWCNRMNKKKKYLRRNIWHVCNGRRWLFGRIFVIFSFFPFIYQAHYELRYMSVKWLCMRLCMCLVSAVMIPTGYLLCLNIYSKWDKVTQCNIYIFFLISYIRFILRIAIIINHKRAFGLTAHVVYIVYSVFIFMNHEFLRDYSHIKWTHIVIQFQNLRMCGVYLQYNLILRL